jgi:endoglucanase
MTKKITKSKKQVKQDPIKTLPMKYVVLILVAVFGLALILNRALPRNEPDRQALPTATLNSPVAANGQLHVCGLKLCNQYDQVIQLRSMASLGGGQYAYRCTTPETVNYAASIGADIVRVVIFSGLGDDNKTTLIDSLIKTATARGLYVLIDWHGIGNPSSTQSRAVTFFDWISKTYGNQNNILYEPFNEPDNTVTWTNIRNYHQVIVNTIRANDPDGIILLGNEGWDKQPLKSGGAQRIKDNPVIGTNLMYTVHVYAEELETYAGLNSLTSLTNAANIIPIFVSEWGYYSYLGSANGIKPELGQVWVDKMRQLDISWIAWWFVDYPDPFGYIQIGSCTTKSYSLNSPTGNEYPSGVLVAQWQNNPADSWSSATATTIPPTATKTAIPATQTSTATRTPVPATNTLIPATNTPTATSTKTRTPTPSFTPTFTATWTPVPPTVTFTPTVAASRTSIPPTGTFTQVPATIIPSATNTKVPATITPTATPTPPPAYDRCDYNRNGRIDGFWEWICKIFRR